jgi:hypothetical protein
MENDRRETEKAPGGAQKVSLFFIFVVFLLTPIEGDGSIRHPPPSMPSIDHVTSPAMSLPNSHTPAFF